MSLTKLLFEHEELNLVQSVFSEKNLFLFYEKQNKTKLQKAFWVEINQCLLFLIGFKMEHFDASLSTYFRAWLGPRGKVVLSLALPSFLLLLVIGNLWILHEDSLETMLIFQWLDTRGLESWSREQVQCPLTAGAETQVLGTSADFSGDWTMLQACSLSIPQISPLLVARIAQFLWVSSWIWFSKYTAAIGV